MLHQALLLMDILEIVFCLSNRYHSSISYEQQRLSAWMAVAAYLLEKCLCKKFYCVKSSNPAPQQMVQDTINICSPWQSF